MNKNIKIFFFISVTFGSVIYAFQKLKIPIPKIINNYFNDFFIIPIVLFFCLTVLKIIHQKKNYSLHLLVILYLCALYSVLFEYVFPKFLNRYTADFIDILLYFSSGILFYALQSSPKKNNTTQL